MLGPDEPPAAAAEKGKENEAFLVFGNPMLIPIDWTGSFIHFIRDCLLSTAVMRAEAYAKNTEGIFQRM